MAQLFRLGVFMLIAWSVILVAALVWGKLDSPLTIGSIVLGYVLAAFLMLQGWMRRQEPN